MDFAHTLRGFFPLDWLSIRIRSLQAKLSEEPYRGHKRKFLAVAFLITSISFGILAFGQAREEAIKSWERAHLPSLQVWVLALSTRGYRTLSDIGEIQKLARSLPTTLDSEGSIWVDRDLNWVVLYHDINQALPAHIFYRDIRKKPEAWSPRGIGWAHFDSTLNEVDAMLAKAPKILRKKAEPITDPREIRY